MIASSRIVFMGTPAFAVPSLEILVRSPHKVVGVVTTPDKPAGRGLKTTLSAVKERALEIGIPILQPENLEDDVFLKELEALNADIFVVVAFRKLPIQVWSMPPRGTFNLHASLLPDFRGAAPIQRSIMSGVDRTGLTTFLIDEHIDTGGILLQSPMTIDWNDTAGDLHDRMMVEGSRMVLETVDLLTSGRHATIPQDELLPSHGIIHSAKKIQREDCLINFNRPWREIRNQIRGLSPFPGAYTNLHFSSGESKTLKVLMAEGEDSKHGISIGEIESDGLSYLKVACLDGWLNLSQVQLEGRRRMGIKELLRGLDTSGLSKAY